jgi:hypothetical protein
MSDPETIAALIARIAARDARDSFERATGWIVVCAHPVAQAATQTLYGPFQEPGAALTWADQHEREMREDDGRWRCVVLPVMPVT